MNTDSYNEAKKALEKEDHALQNAAYDLKGGFFLATANRAYYCMTALLQTQDTFAKTHQGIRSKFSELFIKTGVFPTSASDTITILFDYRQEADYDVGAEITINEAQTILERAGSFLTMATDYFQQLENNASQ
jgi:uncharacterized protein (UPF0332 family)